MARTITEIFDEIIAAKEADANLDTLTSTSNVAIWRLWAYITATAIWVHETLWDLFKVEVEAIAARAVPGTAAWYAARVLEFQYDPAKVFTIIFNADNVPVYDIISPEDRIITRVAINELTDGTVLIKVAKDDGGGGLAPLTTTELTALNGYIDKIRFAGTRTQTLSLPSDKIVVTMTVFYDPVNDPAIIQANTEAAIEAYLAGLEFDGQVYTERIQDAVQALSGVVSVELGSVEIEGVPNITIDRVATLSSGYAEVSTTSPLSATITYTPNS